MTSSNISARLVKRSGLISGQIDAKREFSHCVDSGRDWLSISSVSWLLAASHISSCQISSTFLPNHPRMPDIIENPIATERNAITKTGRKGLRELLELVSLPVKA